MTTLHIRRRLAALALPGLAAGLLILPAGCGGDGTKDLPEGGAARTEAESELIDDALRSGQLSALPAAVQQAARRDLGDATPTGSRAQSTEAGILYRVRFVNNGKPGSVVYDAAGRYVSGERPASAGEAGESPEGTAVTGDGATPPPTAGTPPTPADSPDVTITPATRPVR